MHGDQHWKWREQLLAHPNGRADGGEPCVQCGSPVPSNAYFRHRDRHVCCSRCNSNLSRKFNRRLASYGEAGFEVPKPPPTPDPREGFDDPLYFSGGLFDGGDNGLVFLGFSPRPGDVVERYGHETFYLSVEPTEANFLTGGQSQSVVAVCHISGWRYIVGADEVGRVTRLVWATVGPDGMWFVGKQPFNHEGIEYGLVQETIRDVDSQGNTFDWRAYLLLPTTLKHPSPFWTTAYEERSERLRRTTASSGRHERRVRLKNVAVERFDPHEIYVRDKWVCQLCFQPVDQSLDWPDPMYPSLDHIVPLAANGEHSRKNTQLAHWICNVRKGASLSLN